MLLSNEECAKKTRVTDIDLYEKLFESYLNDEESINILLHNISRFKNYTNQVDHLNAAKTYLRNVKITLLRSKSGIKYLNDYTETYILNGPNNFKFKIPFLSRLHAAGIIFGIRIEILIDSEYPNQKVLKLGSISPKTIKFIYENSHFYLIGHVKNQTLISNPVLYGENVLTNQVILKTGIKVTKFDINRYPERPPYYKLDGYIKEINQISPISKVEFSLFLDFFRKFKICFYCTSAETLNQCTFCNIFYCTNCILKASQDAYLPCFFCGNKIKTKPLQLKSPVPAVQPKLLLFDSIPKNCKICENPSKDAVYICAICGSLGLDKTLMILCSDCNFFPVFKDSRCILCTNMSSSVSN